MSNSLKPCPFCGKAAVTLNQAHYGDLACCGDLHCAGRSCMVSLDAWNTRAVPDQPDDMSKLIKTIETERDKVIKVYSPHAPYNWCIQAIKDFASTLPMKRESAHQANISVYNALGGADYCPICGAELDGDYECVECKFDLYPYVKAPMRESGWQPVETAPKDGTIIWAWDDKRGSNPAIWCNDSEVWVITYDDAEIVPTHWMPLPEIPRRGTDE